MQRQFLGLNLKSTEGNQITVNQEDRFQHTHVVGQTGTGKSHFMKDSFLQDVRAGFGGLFVDFHGEDARWLLDYIPENRLDDVIYLDPLNEHSVIGYNVLDGIEPRDYASYTSDVVASLHHIYSDSWGPRMNDILKMSIRPLFDLPPESKGTVLGVVRFLADPHYRNWVVKQCRDQTVRNFWLIEYAGWSKNDKGAHLNSSLNKIRCFHSPPLLHCLGQQKSRVSFKRAIEQGQIVICDFNKWRMASDNASILASLIISRLIYEATRRAKVEGQEQTPFHVYIDEFQTVTSLSVIEALSGIRKYRVGFTLAHQYASQLDQKVLAAIKGNVGTRVVFRVGGEDADLFQRSMDIGNPKELSDLADYHFVTQYKLGSSVALDRGMTEPLQWERYGYGRSIERRMMADFGMPIAQLDETYERWMQSRHYGGQAAGAIVRKEKAETNAAKPRKFTGMKSFAHLVRGG